MDENEAPLADAVTIDDVEDTPLVLVLLTAADPDDPDGSGAPPVFRLSDLPANGGLFTDLPDFGGLPILADTDYAADFFADGKWQKIAYFIPDANWSGSTRPVRAEGVPCEIGTAWAAAIPTLANTMAYTQPLHGAA